MSKSKHETVDVICTQFTTDAGGYKLVVGEYPKRFNKQIWDNKISKMKFGNMEFRLAPKKEKEIEPTVPDFSKEISNEQKPVEQKTEIALTVKEINLMKKETLIAHLIKRYGGSEDEWQFTNAILKQKLIDSLTQGL